MSKFTVEKLKTMNSYIMAAGTAKYSHVHCITIVIKGEMLL
jgi:hypothetical protein